MSLVKGFGLFGFDFFPRFHLWGSLFGAFIRGEEGLRRCWWGPKHAITWTNEVRETSLPIQSSFMLSAVLGQSWKVQSCIECAVKGCQKSSLPARPLLQLSTEDLQRWSCRAWWWNEMDCQFSRYLKIFRLGTLTWSLFTPTTWLYINCAKFKPHSQSLSQASFYPTILLRHCMKLLSVGLQAVALT